MSGGGAVQALGEIGPPAKESVSALINVLRSDEDVLVCQYAVEALAKMAPRAKQVISAFDEALKDKEEWVRRAGREALESISIAEGANR